MDEHQAITSQLSQKRCDTSSRRQAAGHCPPSTWSVFIDVLHSAGPGCQDCVRTSSCSDRKHGASISNSELKSFEGVCLSSNHACLTTSMREKTSGAVALHADDLCLKRNKHFEKNVVGRCFQELEILKNGSG